MAISHRLSSSMYERPDDSANEAPKRIIFLSVEGNVTERDYFRHVQKYRRELRVNSVVHIEILSRGRDTRSDPMSVLGLLEEYLKLREEGITKEEIIENASRAERAFTLEQVEEYLAGRLPERGKAELEDALNLVGVDLSYQEFLSKFKGEDGNDIFAVVVDRDSGCHSQKGLKKLYENCAKKGYDCYITNPCFEFWLLLHVCDVRQVFSGRLEELIGNKRISAHHTVVSGALSGYAEHAKAISEDVFKKYYLPNVDTAIARAGQFEQDREGLLTNLGSNLPALFEKMRETC